MRFALMTFQFFSFVFSFFEGRGCLKSQVFLKRVCLTKCVPYESLSQRGKCDFCQGLGRGKW